MQNKNLIGIDKTAAFLPMKSIAYAFLFSMMVFPASQLYAQQSSYGQDSHGPAPHHRHQGKQQQGGNIDGVKNLAYYGDWDSTRVFIIDIENMTLLEVVDGTGEGPYGVDQQDATKAYVLTRKTDSMTIIDNYTMENTGEVYLDHKPRSTNFNPATGLSLVSGADKVMTSIIRVNHDRVMQVFGYNETATPTDFGGSLATGHPLWVDDRSFFMLDRAERQIQLWSGRDGLLSVIHTPTSVHHIFQSHLKNQNDIYYAVVEGNQKERLSPSVLRFKIHKGQMVVTGESVLSDYAPELLDPAVMGSHHAAFHPDGVHIYIGSAEGHVFVVNKNSMRVVAMIDTGIGSGHTTFAATRNLAFVTNHNDTDMTVIDTTDHSWLKDIKVAETMSDDYKSQSHTSAVSPDMKYFYSAASHDGVFFEIDMETLEVSRTVVIGEYLEEGERANILMGSFIWDGDSENDM